MNLGYVALLIQKKLYARALEYMESIASENTNDHSTKIQYYKAICHTNLRHYEKALHLFDLVLASKLGFVYVYQCKMIKGYIYTVTKKSRLAELEFYDLLQSGYESTRVYAAIGHVYYAQGKTSQAVQYLQKALEMNPDNPTALNSMSYIFAENNIKLNVAAEYILRALNKAPENPSYLDTYGVVLCKMGKFDEAKRVLDQAYKISKDPAILKHVKLAIQRKGI